MKLKIDLHIHTNHSPCGTLSAEKIEKIALRCGLNGIAITDHNTIKGALELLKVTSSLKVIVGEEIRTNHGEIIGYFLKEEIPPMLSVQKTIDAIKKQGGLVSIPHPFDPLRKSRITRNELEKVIAAVDMIEVFNSRDILQKTDHAFIQKAAKKGIVPVVSSDAHQGIEIGRSYVVMDDFHSPQEFLANIKNAQLVCKKSPFWVHIITKIAKYFS